VKTCDVYYNEKCNEYELVIGICAKDGGNYSVLNSTLLTLEELINIRDKINDRVKTRRQHELAKNNL
jgi:hypothetical protein